MATVASISTTTGSAPRLAPKRKPPAVPNAVFGMLIFVTTEAMFFLALVSAFLVIEAGLPGGWEPPKNIQLPVVATAINTLVLFASAGFLWRSGQLFRHASTQQQAASQLSWSLLLGTLFVVFQGIEWVQLINFGMTMSSGIFGACFFLLLGAHGLHALGALIGMAFVLRNARRGTLALSELRAMQIFWFFIVAVWPVLYVLVYF